MNSEKTARIVAQFRSLLQRAIEAKDDDLIKQYYNGLVYAKSEHIEALEQDLAIAKLQARRAA
jgi:hypothetical protein